MQNHTETIVVGVGELLWDVYPDGKQLGGATTNFAYHSALLGNRGVIASRTGEDALGQEALLRLEQLGLTTAYVQRDAARPTGTVQVKVDDKGQPDFTITENVAWDFMEWTAEWQALAAQAGAVCFGSLAQRSPASRATIRRFLQATRQDALRVFDVNLRQTFFSATVLAESLGLAQIVKLNDAELPRIIKLLELGAGRDEEESARRLLTAYGLELVCVTRGAHGSLLVTTDQTVAHPGFTVQVADTVGSGDAFTAALAHYYRRQSPLERISDAANRLGAWVATQVGGTPTVDRETLRQIIGE